MDIKYEKCDTSTTVLTNSSTIATTVAWLKTKVTVLKLL